MTSYYDDRVATRLAATLDAAVAIDTMSDHLHIVAVRDVLLDRGDLDRRDVLAGVAQHRPSLLLDTLARLDELSTEDLAGISDATLATAVSAHLSRPASDRRHLPTAVWRTVIDGGGEAVAGAVLGAYDGGIDDDIAQRAVAAADLDDADLDSLLVGQRVARFAGTTRAGCYCRDRAMTGAYGEVTTEVGLEPDDITTWVQTRLPVLVADGDPVTDGLVDHLGGVAPWIVAPALAEVAEQFLEDCAPNVEHAEVLLDDFGVGTNLEVARRLWADAADADPAGHDRAVGHLLRTPSNHGVADWGVAGHAAELLVANPTVPDPYVVAAIGSGRGHRHGTWHGLAARAAVTEITAAVLTAAVEHRAPTWLLRQLIAACGDGANVALLASAGDVAMTQVVDALVETRTWNADLAQHLHVDTLRCDGFAADAVDDALALLAETIGTSSTRARLFAELDDYDGTVGELCATLAVVT